eukprot:scaffold77181_cov17-Tisochrysis_lutea.AAC.2
MGNEGMRARIQAAVRPMLLACTWCNILLRERLDLHLAGCVSSFGPLVRGMQVKSSAERGPEGFTVPVRDCWLISV